MEFIQDDVKPDVPELKYGIPFDPRQQSDPLQAGLAALAIRPSSSSSSVDEPSTTGPSRFTEPWGIRNDSQGRIPEGDLGPADPPRKRGRPKGSKSRPRVSFALSTLPERQEKIKAEERLARMSLK